MKVKQLKIIFFLVFSSQSLVAGRYTNLWKYKITDENIVTETECPESLVENNGINESIYLQVNNEKELKIRINKGRKFTNKREIEVEIRPIKLSSTLVAKMKIGFAPDLKDAEWETFKSNKFLNISGGDREVIVYAKLKDKAGNESPVEKAKIILDSQPPSNGSVIINKGSQYTNVPEFKVRLSIKAEEAFKMQISNTGTFSSSQWEDYVPEKNWIIGPRNEGEKRVYVRFADKAANISEPVSTTIKVDLTPPTGTIVINDGAKYTNSRKVKLKIQSDDATVVRIVGPGIRNFPYEKSETDGFLVKEWELDSLEGQKFVKVYFRDNAGNISKQTIMDDIILDTSPPKIGFFKINDGNKYCTDKEGKVTLKIGTREDLETFKMFVSNDKSFKDVQARNYQPKIDHWQLEAGEDGLKTVYIKFVDNAGNISKIATAKIYLDRKPPIAKKIIVNDQEEWVNNQYADLTVEAEGAHFMEFSNNPKFSQMDTWIKYSPQKSNWELLSQDGKNTVYVRFKDLAGNISETVSDYIYKDTKAPTGKISINTNAKYTNSTDKKVKLKLKFDSDAYQMQINNEPGFNNISWVPVTPTIDDWILDGEDGEKRIFVRFKDKAENISEIIASGITLDRQPPLYPSVIINNDSVYATNMSKQVTLELKAEDATMMMISDNQEFNNSKWENYISAKSFILPGADGEKEVFVKFKDQAGNVSAINSDKILLDRFPPKSISFSINNGDEWTNNKNKDVTLQIEANDATHMIIADNPSFSGAAWQEYRPTLKYTLPGEDGTKTIYITFKDMAQHKSEILSATIKLKREF